jgi:hypothetical protein
MKHLHLILVCVLLNACAYPAAKPESKEPAKTEAPKKASKIPVTKAVAQQAAKGLFYSKKSLDNLPTEAFRAPDDASVTLLVKVDGEHVLIDAQTNVLKADPRPGALQHTIYSSIDDSNLLGKKFNNAFTYDATTEKSQKWCDPRTHLIFYQFDQFEGTWVKQRMYKIKTQSFYYPEQFARYLKKYSTLSAQVPPSMHLVAQPSTKKLPPITDPTAKFGPVTKGILHETIEWLRINNATLSSLPKEPFKTPHDAAITCTIIPEKDSVAIDTVCHGKRGDEKLFSSLRTLIKSTILHDAHDSVEDVRYDSSTLEKHLYLDPTTKVLAYRCSSKEITWNAKLRTYIPQQLLAPYLPEEPTKSISPCKDCELRRTKLFDDVTTPETLLSTLSSTSKPEPLYPTLAPPAPRLSSMPEPTAPDIFAGMTIHTQEPQPDIFDGLLDFVDVPTKPLITTKPDVKPAKKEAVIVEMA